jgi:Tol biopolymer transport system component
MRRGRRIFLPLAIACLASSACASPQPPADSPASLGPDPSRSVLISVLSDRIYLVDPETGASTTVVEGLTDFQAGFAAWGPDHRVFAYGDGGIMIVDARSGRIRTLIAHQGLSMPAWSPDGAHLAYGDGRNLWTSPVDHLQATYLRLPLTLGPLGMAWQPGPSVVFQGLELECRIPKGCSSTDRSDLWTILPNGTGLTRVTMVEDAEAPKWSPDGSRLLFIRAPSRAEGGGELWVSSPDGSGARRVFEGADVVAADWSPDGNRLALVRQGEQTGELQLWLADRAGSNAQPVGPPIPGTSATVDW